MTAALAAVIVVLTGLSTAGATTTPTQPPNSIGVRLAEVPENRAQDPRAFSSILDHVIPGATLTRRMEVVSTVPEPVTVELFGANARIDSGSFRPDPTLERGISDWVTVDPSQLTLEPMATEIVEITITVPSSTPTGEYYGAVFAEPPASQGSAAVVNRVGIRVYLSVGSGDEPPVDFVVGAMTAGRDSDGTPYVSTDLRNTGGRALDIGGELTLSEGPAGLDAGPFPFDEAVTLLPGDIQPLRIELDPELPDGPWLARLDAFSGLLERSAEAEVVFPSEAGETAAPAESETIGGTDADGNDISEELRRQRRTLLPLAAILILLALGSLWLMLMWKRGDDDEEDDEHTPAGAAAGVGDDDGG